MHVIKSELRVMKFISAILTSFPRNCKFLSHNSDYFYHGILRGKKSNASCNLAIARKKVRIVRLKNQHYRFTFFFFNSVVELSIYRFLLQ